MISQDLMDLIRRGFALRLDGIHGEAHWGRVHANGLRLAKQTGADVEIVTYFAYLHDSQRLNDGWDKKHGQRAAEFVETLPVSLVPLSNGKLELLIYACSHHSEGLTQANVTVQTCWDADRLDLGRIGIKPKPKYLCTPAAKEPAMIKWALQQSRQVIYQTDW